MKNLILIMSIVSIISIFSQSVEIKKAYNIHPQAGSYFLNIWIADILVISHKL